MQTFTLSVSKSTADRVDFSPSFENWHPRRIKNRNSVGAAEFICIHSYFSTHPFFSSSRWILPFVLVTSNLIVTREYHWRIIRIRCATIRGVSRQNSPGQSYELILTTRAGLDRFNFREGCKLIITFKCLSQSSVLASLCDKQPRNETQNGPSLSLSGIVSFRVHRSVPGLARPTVMRSVEDGQALWLTSFW